MLARRGISLLLSLCIMGSLLPTQVLAVKLEQNNVQSHSFTDVDKDSWYNGAVQYVWERGFFSGTGDNTFDPNGTMTRSMFVTVLGRMAGVDTKAYSGQSAFQDVSMDKYYAPYVAWAAKHGITTGTDNGMFSPDALISRQQMAAFLVRYFDTFGVKYNTNANITAVPADLDIVADWARDPVCKLWETGLLNGDGVNFNPNGNATRAQAATLCMRADEAVKAWYKEPGVPANPRGTTSVVAPTEGSTLSGFSEESVTRYYEVQFALGEGQDATDLTLPETKTYVSGTIITELPTPYQRGSVFLGWYYDAALTDQVETTDTVTHNMTLYARMAKVEDKPFLESPSYRTKTDVGTDFTFQVKADSEQEVRDALTITQISANNTVLTDISITSAGNGIYTVAGGYVEGHTYQASLDKSSNVVFLLDGEEQPVSVDDLNFITAKEHILNLDLEDSVKYIPKSSVSNMSEGLTGLFNVSMGNGADGSIKTVEDNGSFTYTGPKTLAVGDTVAIYTGTKPDMRTMTTDNDSVAYVNITAVDGTTYSYTTADVSDVLDTPDVLPVSVDSDTNPGDGNVLTVDKSVLDFSHDKYAAMRLDSQTTLNVGDFIAFYEGGFGSHDANVTSYVEITGLALEQDKYTVTYKPTTLDTVMAAMDIHNTRTEKIEMTEAEIATMEADIESQAIDSGFVEKAVNYLAAVALETDGFRQLSEDVNIKSFFATTDEVLAFSPRSAGSSKGNVKITEKTVNANIKAGTNALEHFKDSAGGIRAELTVGFKLEVKASEGSANKIVISVNAAFEQELLLGINVSGGAIWKWAWIFPYVYDYQLNANFDVGTYTGIAVTATMSTSGGDEAGTEAEGGSEDDGNFLNFEWGTSLGGNENNDQGSNQTNNNEDESDPIVNIGKQIEDLINAKQQFFGENIEETGEGEDSIYGSLLEQYAKMMEGAESSWIELVREEIFNKEGSVDPYHILVYGVSADFVVAANVYVTLGMTFEYANAKRYNFSLLLFQKQSTHETIDLETEHYEFIFYVMGTLGIRAGIEFELAVGLFSLKLDSIGITAEAGAYAQLWGYFYYKLAWKRGSNQEQFYAGAMHFEIGIYLDIKFKAQLFSSEALTYKPTLYENQWPLFTVGERENVYDFNYDEDEELLTYELQTVKTLVLPKSLFDMRYMDLQTGELYGADADDPEKNPAAHYDDATESRFNITFSNPAFSYNPDGNIVTVTPSSTSVSEKCEMTITWRHGTLDFTSLPISRTITIIWSDPSNARYINFNSMGGSSVEMLSTAAGVPISAPPDPVKEGYTFGGWFEDANCTRPFTFPGAMPNYAGPNHGITVYAKWNPAMNSYKVEYYTEQLNGTYALTNSLTKEGYTGSPTSADINAPKGFVYNSGKSTTNQTIAHNGSTVVKVYYDRNQYNLTFSYGAGYTSDRNPDLVYENIKYGASIHTPTINLRGYMFDGWTDSVAVTMPAGNTTYIAKWKPAPNTPYRVEHYQQSVNGSSYALSLVEQKTGQTGASVNVTDLKRDGLVGLTYVRASVNGVEVTSTKIPADGRLVIKLYYDRNSYQVTFNSQGGSPVNAQTVRYGAHITEPGAPTRQNYVFAGWHKEKECINQFDFNSETMPAHDLTLYAKWTVGAGTKLTVSFNSKGGSSVPSQSVEYGKTATKPNDPTRIGCTFNGWYSDPDRTIPYDFGNTPVTGDITLYAGWIFNQYTVTFNAGPGTLADGKKSKTVIYGGSYGDLPTPTYSGYNFTGWYTAEQNGTQVTARTYVNKAENHILYARWVKA